MAAWLLLQPKCSLLGEVQALVMDVGRTLGLVCAEASRLNMLSTVNIIKVS